MYQWKKLFPLQGEERKWLPQNPTTLAEVYLSQLFRLLFFPFLSFSCSRARDQNLTWVTRKQDSDGCRGSDLEQLECPFTSHIQCYVLHRKTVTTNSQSTTVKITKPIHPGCWKAGGSGKENDTGKGGRGNYSNQFRHRSWQMLKNSWKTLVLSDLAW